MAYQLDYSQAGQIIVTGDRRFTVHLSSIATFNTSEITVSAVVVDSAVVLREIEGGVEHKFDIRDCSDPVYATPEDLMSDIEDQVAAMYAGGGGAVTSDDVSNESAVSGATVTDALNALASSSTPADLPYTYTNATSGDPTSGKIGFNTTTPASINSVRIHFTDGNGVSQSGLVSQLNTTGGTMLFRWSGGSLVLRIGSSSGSFGSWASYDATYVSGTLPADGTAMSVDVGLYASVPKIYRAVLVSDGSNITASNVDNELGGTPSYSTDGTGLWTITITGAFPSGKTWPSIQQAGVVPEAMFSSIRRISDDAVEVRTLDTSLVEYEPVRQQYVLIEVTP